MNISEFKAANPAYQDMADKELADALHAKFYSDMPKDQFYKSVGLDTAPRERSWWEATKDSGAQLGEGVNNILGAIPNLVAPESDTAAFFNDGSEHWREQQSDALKARIKAASEAIDEAGKDSIGDQALEAMYQYSSDPALAARFVVTNLPSLVPGVAAAKAAQAASIARGATAARAAMVATTTAGATNAVLNGGGARGEAYRDIKDTLMRQGVPEVEAEQKAIEDSRLPAGVGAATGFLSGKTGLESAIAGAGRAGAAGAARRAAGATVTELLGEQAEEVLPKIATNYEASEYDGRDLSRDVGRTMVETAIGSGPGAIYGGWAAARNAPMAPAEDAPRAEPTIGDIGAASTLDEAIQAANAAVDAAGPAPASRNAAGEIDAMEDAIADAERARQPGAPADVATPDLAAADPVIEPAPAVSGADATVWRYGENRITGATTPTSPTGMLYNDPAEVTETIERARAEKSQAERNAILDGLMESEQAAGMSQKQLARAFGKALAKAGYTNASLNETEVARISRMTGMRDAIAEDEAPLPSSPNELVDAVPEKRAPAPAPVTDDPMGRVRNLLGDGFTLQGKQMIKGDRKINLSRSEILFARQQARGATSTKQGGTPIPEASAAPELEAAPALEPAEPPAPAKPATKAKTKRTGGQRSRDRLRDANPFLAFLAETGINPADRSDTGAEAGRRGNPMLPGYGPIFRRTGMRFDQLAEAARAAGFLSQADIDNANDNGGTNKLMDMIRRAITQREVIRPGAGVDAAAENVADAALMEEAARLGIDTAQSPDAIYDAVVAEHARMEEAREAAGVESHDEHDEIADLADQFNDAEAAYAAELLRDPPLEGGIPMNNLTDEELDAIFGPQTKAADARQAESDSPSEAGQGATRTGASGEFDLEGYTAEEVTAKQDAEAARKQRIADERRRLEEGQKERLNKKETERRIQDSADNFQLGQSADDAVSGQADIFSQPAPAAASKPAPLSLTPNADGVILLQGTTIRFRMNGKEKTGRVSNKYTSKKRAAGDLVDVRFASLNPNNPSSGTARVAPEDILEIVSGSSWANDPSAKTESSIDAGTRKHERQDEAVRKAAENIARRKAEKEAAASATEPWQLTRAEWNRQREESSPEVAQSKFTKNSGSEATARQKKTEWLTDGVTAAAQERLRQAGRKEITLSRDEVDDLLDRINTRVSHQDVIEKALAEGKPVPAEVLADYPDLTPAAAPEQATEEEVAPVDDLADIPRAFQKKVKVALDVWVEDEGAYESVEVSADKALASVREDIDNLEALRRCLKG